MSHLGKHIVYANTRQVYNVQFPNWNHSIAAAAHKCFISIQSHVSLREHAFVCQIVMVCARTTNAHTHKYIDQQSTIWLSMCCYWVRINKSVMLRWHFCCQPMIELSLSRNYTHFADEIMFFAYFSLSIHLAHFYWMIELKSVENIFLFPFI